MSKKQKAEGRRQKAVGRGLRRRGISVIVVLGLIAVTLAASYAVMRSQVSAVRIEQNSNRQNLARQAAMVGLSVAIRTMEQSSWAGVNTTLTRTLNGQDSYSATYTAGDDSLTSASSAYSEYPYRVTIVSTGISVDPSNSQSKATHKVRAVMRLLPRKLSSGPSDLATIVNYTLYQTQNDTFQFQFPLHVKGKVRVQGTVTQGSDYQLSDGANNRYLSDLVTMWLMGIADDRPFEGPLELSFNQNSSTVQNWLTNTVGVSLISNSNTGMSSQWVFPGSVSSYRLYTGGPSYSAPAAPTTLSGTLHADPIANPLGLFYQASDITLNGNAALHGTLIGGSRLTIAGTNVSLRPVDLMPLQGSSNKIRLPTLLLSYDLTVASTGVPTIKGLVATFNGFMLSMGSQANVISMRGNLVARNFVFSGRSEYNLAGIIWSVFYSSFMSRANTGIKYFPMYLNLFSLQPAPSVTFQPPDNPVTYVWPTNGFTVYIADPTDGGLRWELVDWRDLR